MMRVNLIDEACKYGEEVAIAVSAAKALATRIGIDITNRIFEVTGTCATATKYGFDRYWRDLRTFTLQTP